MPVARALVRTALAEREHAADRDTAELLTAELVANAVEHTSGGHPIELGGWSCCARMPGRGARRRSRNPPHDLTRPPRG
ncbi:ATP-binding protein [Streptomyces hirsutus]